VSGAKALAPSVPSSILVLVICLRNALSRIRVDSAMYKKFVAQMKQNSSMEEAIALANRFDVDLYDYARSRFCTILRESEALLHPMIVTELDEKNICIDLWEQVEHEEGDGAEGRSVHQEEEHQEEENPEVQAGAGVR